MADSRSVFKAAMAALFPDNTTQEISAADQRDVQDQQADNAAYLDDNNVFTLMNSFLGHFLFARVQSNAATLTLSTSTIYVHSGSGATWTLPDTTGLAGKVYFLSNDQDSTGNVTIDGNGTDPIAGTDPWVLYPGQQAIFIWVTQYSGSIGTSRWIVWG